MNRIALLTALVRPGRLVAALGLEAGEIPPARAFEQLEILLGGWFKAQGRPQDVPKPAPLKPEPIEVIAHKAPTFARYDAASAKLDRMVARGQITREEANRQLAQLRRQLAIESGAMPANPTVEDSPRYRRKRLRRLDPATSSPR